jgi:hypothetical protein
MGSLSTRGPGRVSPQCRRGVCLPALSNTYALALLELAPPACGVMVLAPCAWWVRDYTPRDVRREHMSTVSSWRWAPRTSPVTRRLL